MHWRLYLAIGIVFGCALLWMLFRTVNVDDVRQVLSQIDPATISLAMLAYVLSLALRSLRWSILLGAITPVRYSRVFLVLVGGYAVNNLLPARLGEIFRANVAKAEFRMAGSSALGTIAVERTIDGLVFVFLLVIGFFALPADAIYHALISKVLIVGTGLFGTIAVVLFLLRRHGIGRLHSLWRFGADKAEKFRHGIASMRPGVIARALAVSASICLADLASIWLLLAALHVVLTGPQLALVIGVVSLSTLLPTAPGYFGTLQFAYVVGVTSFGFSQVEGLAAATAYQAFLLAPITLVGVILMMVNHIRVTTNLRRTDL